MIYRCVVHDGRRQITDEPRYIADVRNGAEVQAVLASICRAKGVPSAGCTMKVWTQDRRPQLAAEVSA